MVRIAKRVEVGGDFGIRIPGSADVKWKIYGHIGPADNIQYGKRLKNV